MKPFVDRLREQYRDQIVFKLYDVDDATSTAAKQKYLVRSQPHFIFLSANGDIAETHFGRITANDFETSLIALIQK